jgi:hypothetical protein
MFSMNRMGIEQRAQVVSLLVEGNGINAITRITEVAQKYRVQAARRSRRSVRKPSNDENVRGLTSKRIQADENWSFCYAKKKNVPAQY